MSRALTSHDIEVSGGDTHAHAPLDLNAVVPFLPFAALLLGIAAAAVTRCRSHGAAAVVEQWTLRRSCIRRGACSRCSKAGRLRNELVRALTLDFVPEVLDMSGAGLLFTFVVIVATFAHVWSKADNLAHDGTSTMPWGRGLGTAATITLSMVALPVSRTSLWVRLLGLPFERALKYHRILARLFFVVMWLHGILAINEYKLGAILSGTSAASPAHPPLLGLAAAATFTFVVLLALEPIRRRFFELFYYSHFLVFVGIALALIHNSTLAAYGAPAALLYACDRWMRWRRSHASVRTLHAEDHGSFVSLVLAPKSFTGWSAGQYVMVNVPAVSKLQWHPASISCRIANDASDGSRAREVDPVGHDESHVREMGPPGTRPAAAVHGAMSLELRVQGPGSWTSMLAERIRTCDDPKDLEVRLDGPLGHLAVDTSAADVVVLVAGGIGITFVFSVVDELAARTKSAAPQRLVLVWSCRDVELLRHFAPRLAAVAATCPHVALRLHFTGEADDEISVGLVGLPRVLRARPDVSAVVEAERGALESGRRSSGAVLACGPSKLVHAARCAAANASFGFHAETFEF